jgi:hypothetical protein
MKRKHPNHWVVGVPNLLPNIVGFQSIWRGYVVRNRLRLAGKGVLKRSICHNEDELITLETTKEIHPFDYFSFEQEGKVWWFNQKSMIEMAQRTDDLINPYNRTPLAPEDIRRLRNLIRARKMSGLPMTVNEMEHTSVQVCEQRWRKVLHAFHECGFVGIISHDFLMDMSHTRLRFFLFCFLDTLGGWSANSRPQSKKMRMFSWIRTCHNSAGMYSNVVSLSNDVAGILIKCINEFQNPTELVFLILSALTQSHVLALGL